MPYTYATYTMPITHPQIPALRSFLRLAGIFFRSTSLNLIKKHIPILLSSPPLIGLASKRTRHIR